MDFTWVKELADQANKQEHERREKERRDAQMAKQMALATAPFVEKLHQVMSTCSEEFNKHIQYQELKVLATRVQKAVKRTLHPEDPELTYAEESTSFTFSRKDWTYGIRGCKGEVEFIEVPNSGGLGVRLDDVGATPSRKLVAQVDEASQKIVWKQDGQVMDGQAIVSICKDYFREFIDKTNQ